MNDDMSRSKLPDRVLLRFPAAIMCDFAVEAVGKKTPAEISIPFKNRPRIGLIIQNRGGIKHAISS